MNNILDILEKTASVYPDKVIFEEEEKTITYKAFINRAKLAATAISNIVKPGNAVPIYMDKSIDTLIVMFGAIYAGAFYTIIDTSHPLSRIEQIIATLESEIIITSSIYQEKLLKTGYTGRFILSEEMTANIGCSDDDMLESIRMAHTDRAPLYCNFTSGSTGVPKGVLISHGSVMDFISEFTRIMNISDTDIIGNQAPFDFDVSVKDIFSTIYTGATMVIIPKRKFSFPMELMDYLCDKNITTLIWAVSALCIISTLKGFSYRIPSSIGKVIFSGEVMPVKQLKIWMENVDATYVNVYGPTEITCNCTYHIVDRDNICTELPIGKPFPNERVFLLDEENNLIDDSTSRVRGEICVAGRCLALGYYNNSEQTALHFVQNPLNSRYQETIYRTGDLGEYNDKGELMYSGRKDFQIKHMGHRIELLEIENAFNDITEIKRVCCIFNRTDNNIYAYYTGDIEKRQIRKTLLKTIPSYMIPTKMVRIDEFPLNKNGKIDRKRLEEQAYEV